MTALQQEATFRWIYYSTHSKYLINTKNSWKLAIANPTLFLTHAYYQDDGQTDHVDPLSEFTLIRVSGVINF